MLDYSILQLSDRLVTDTKSLSQTAQNEEELKIGFEKMLEPALKSIGIEANPRFERLGAKAKTIYRGRPDAVHGQVIIEYEHPFAFSSNRAVLNAYDQLVDYMSAESLASPMALSRLIGVGFDGYSIFFVKYRGKSKESVRKEDFVQEGPYFFDPEAARTLLTYLRALGRLPLTAENLANRFGPKSHIAPMAVSAFADALEYWGGEKVRTFFEEWKRLFGIVYGEKSISSQKKEEVAKLSELYKVGRETDFQELLFSVHTYFALLMKFIAAELLTLKETAFTSSFCNQLTHCPRGELEARLIDIEEGGVYNKRGITNFLEGDFFRWYLDSFSSPRLREAIREIARALSEFEPATTSIDPASSRDLLKKLYQYLVPQEVRHKLGEYYTPEWLAELVINEVGYDGNTLKRVLDPACGSGTFLVLAIHKAKEYGRIHNEPRLETVKRIITNIWGFDLNPLAIIASRTNYLFALGEMVQELPSLEIPIYLADSVLWPERNSQMRLDYIGGDYVPVPTSIKDFHVPAIWIKHKGFLMNKAAPIVEEMAKHHFRVSEAMERFKREGLVFPPHEKTVENFYKEIVSIAEQGKNGIWARFLKNVFAPMVAGIFDFVIGNPPWIRWVYLSQEYRQATLNLWKEYGLFSLKGHAARLGGGEKDFSMLFTFAVTDYYLRKGGKLGFLITQEVFKSKGAGEGFRRFRLGTKVPFRVLKAHDLVKVRPFEGAANKTAAIILKKGQETKYPVPYTLWTRKKGIGKVPTDLALDEAIPLLGKEKLLAQPIGSPVGSWQTIRESQKGLSSIRGKNMYQARVGARVEPYGVFWLEVKQVLANGDLLICNLTKEGNLKIQQVEGERIEVDLVYPAVRGSDIETWSTSPRIYVLITQNPEKRIGYAETRMKREWPRTYGYLLRFKRELLDRAAYRKYHAEAGHPFYSQYNIADYTFARYKVVWKRMASDIIAAVVDQHKTPFGYKTLIPTDTTSLFGIDNETEAHYLCAVINSSPVREFIKSYSSAGRGFGAPSAMNHVGIPRFDPKDKLHIKLAQMSKNLHEMKVRKELDNISEFEDHNDRLVERLFGLKD